MDSTIPSMVLRISFLHFRTSTLVHIFDNTATITAKDPVADDLESEVVWNGIAKVISKNLPSKHSAANLANVFKCV
jgi:hypothetical protein